MKSRYYLDIIVLWILFMMALSLSWGDTTVTGLLMSKQNIPDDFIAPQSAYNENNIVTRYDGTKVFVQARAPWIYENCYYYNFGYEEWEELRLEGSGTQEWILSRGSAMFEPTLDNIQNGRAYVACYSCYNIKGSWKCGCLSKETGADAKTEEEDCGHWQLQTVDIFRK